MQALPAHPDLLGHLGDRQAVLKHCQDRLVTLLNHWNLLEHHAHSFRLSHQPRTKRSKVSRINRDGDNHQPTA